MIFSNLIGKLETLLNFFNRKPLDIEIDRIIKAMNYRDKKIKKMQIEAEHACCPSCFFGRQYTTIVNKQERSAKVLLRLLKKRNCQKDIPLIESLKMDYP